MQDIINQLLQEIAAMKWVEWVMFVAAILYLIMASRESIWCWIWGIISCSCWGYASFVYYDLWLDSALQVFYVVISFVGIYKWKVGVKDKNLPISRIPPNAHYKWIGIGILLSLLFGYFFDDFTPADATYLDAFTTIFSILATFLLLQKKLENWIYWIAIDIAYAYLYWSKSFYSSFLIMLIYLVLAVMAYQKWKKSYSLQIAADL